MDVPRDSSGHRRYGSDDLRWLIFLTKLRRTGMHIQQMLRYDHLVREGEGTADERAAMLVAHRKDVAARIEELRDHLAVIDTKIGLYKSGAMR